MSRSFFSCCFATLLLCCRLLGADSPSAPFLRTVFFADIYHGYALGTTPDAAVVVRTNDGGVTWERVLRENLPIYGIYFRSSSEGWIVGSSGTIFSTADGGATWTKRSGETQEDLFSVTGDAAGTIFIVGKAATMLRSTDGGVTWTRCTIPATGDLLGISSVHSGTLFVLGRNELLKSEDSGVTWVKHGPYQWQHLSAFAFVDDDVGFVGTGPVLQTINGGRTLSPLSVPVDYPGLLVRVVDPSTLYLLASKADEGGVVLTPGQKVPSHSTIFKSTNMGAKWEPIFEIDDKNSHSASLLDLFFIGDHGWAVGEQGTVVFTKDAGKTWQKTRVLVK